ncbi:glycosyltransferase family 2 protein [Alkalitalea saponilacus]|uniref:Glycosyltransferase n=1 Tax=Alkalitalea saponilacus TaxID=889453 RepID=A0A1T5D0C3_9BACT|nr:glycosyltransferase family 2 protein [Alkalitalea saponilacus]ASB50543.1 glycosyl transferase [Alkalitalea saponilacus]SKB65053.1 glycosyltransferase [Alkalitalea saponilacus]
MQISLITVTYNCAEDLRITFDSIRNQNFPDVEYIIIDGGSKDGTIDVIKENEDLIRKWISESDHGIYDAMNKGLKISTGQVIGFLHAGDRFSEIDVLSSVAQKFSSNNCDLLYGDLQYISSKNSANVIRHWKSGSFSQSKLSNGWMPPHPTVYFRREVLNNIGSFDTTYRIAADYDWMVRCLKTPDIRVCYFDKVMILMPTGGASNRSLGNIFRKSSEDFQIIRRNKIGGVGTLLLKNFSKLGQFLRR